MSGKTRTYSLCSGIGFLAAFSLFGASESLAQTRVGIDELPRTLISNDDCTNVDDRGFGWDGTQSCNVSHYRIRGTTVPLIRTSADYTSGRLVWSRDDLRNKMLRCDYYQYQFAASRNAGPVFTKSTYDITFLDSGTTNFNVGELDLTEISTRIITRDWLEVSGSIRVNAPVNFGAVGFSTEGGYLLADVSYRSNGLAIIEEFSDCYLPNEEAPLRASGRCVDNDQDGTGWNGIESCTPPPVDPDCDYNNDPRGWGYNPLTGASCPPVLSSEAQ